jgi:hypothetical protein
MNVPALGGLAAGVRGLAQRVRRRLRPPPVECGGDPDGRLVITVANPMFDHGIGLAELNGPAGVRYTTHPEVTASADVLVSHVPTLRRLPRHKPATASAGSPGAWSRPSNPCLVDLAFRARIDDERLGYQGWRRRPFRPGFLAILEREGRHPFERLARLLLGGDTPA